MYIAWSVPTFGGLFRNLLKGARICDVGGGGGGRHVRKVTVQLGGGRSHKVHRKEPSFGGGGGYREKNTCAGSTTHNFQGEKI